MSREQTSPSAGPRWRRWLFVLHRDTGFVCLGLVLCYAISGVAVNHRHHWNYNYSTHEETASVGVPAVLLGSEPQAGAAPIDPAVITHERQGEIAAAIRAKLDIAAPLRNAFWRSPDRLSLYFGPGEQDVVEYEPATGLAHRTERRERPLLRWLNALHLNEHRRVWTWVADAFAVLLAFLALSGVAMVRGRRGLIGRGGALALAGIVIPVVLVMLLG